MVFFRFFPGTGKLILTILLILSNLILVEWIRSYVFFDRIYGIYRIAFGKRITLLLKANGVFPVSFGNRKLILTILLILSNLILGEWIRSYVFFDRIYGIYRIAFGKRITLLLKANGVFPVSFGNRKLILTILLILSNLILVEWDSILIFFIGQDLQDFMDY